MEKFTVDYFINKFSAIPEEEIGRGETKNKCALYHCGIREMYVDKNPEASALLKIFGAKHDGILSVVFFINDGADKRYQQPTPKQRILAALRDIKEKLNSEQEVKECDATNIEQGTKAGNIKTVIKYVSVPETLSKSVPETILS